MRTTRLFVVLGRGRRALRSGQPDGAPGAAGRARGRVRLPRLGRVALRRGRGARRDRRPAAPVLAAKGSCETACYGPSVPRRIDVVVPGRPTVDVVLSGLDAWPRV